MIFFHHIFRNSLIPTINLLGVNVGWLIGGTVVVESVFSVPGLVLASIFVSLPFVVRETVPVLKEITDQEMGSSGQMAPSNLTVALDPRIQP